MITFLFPQYRDSSRDLLVRGDLAAPGIRPVLEPALVLLHLGRASRAARRLGADRGEPHGARAPVATAPPHGSEPPARANSDAQSDPQEVATLTNQR